MHQAKGGASLSTRSPEAKRASCSGPLQFEALLTSDLRWDRSRRCAALALIIMAMLSSAVSDFCRPEEDPFLLLESCGKAIESILRGHVGRPLRRTWLEQPYGEEEITLLEEEVLPAIQQCLVRVEEIMQALQLEQDLEIQAVQRAMAPDQNALLAETGAAAVGS